MQTETVKLRELTIRYSVKKNQDGQPVLVGRRIRHPSECAPALATLLQDEPSEVFGMLCLTTKHRVIAYHEVGRGTLDTVVVDPRAVFKAALLTNCAALIVAHNHPSGDPTPSPNDVDLTRRLVATGTLLGIPVLDHIVIGDGRYFSFKEQALL